MENIYKIKIRSNPDPAVVYPSERRYSASTILGLSIVHVALACTALLMASLSLQNYQITSDGRNLTIFNMTLIDVDFQSNLAIAPCMMSLCAFATGLAGLVAWKRWYIDHNIRWFFFIALLSTFVSSICVLATIIALVTVHEQIHWFGALDYNQKKPNIRFILSLNMLIACVLELLWSGLSANIAFAGMRNTYPDDITTSRGSGKIEVNTIHKGSNRVVHMVPPDILDHFPNNTMLAKHLARIETTGNLPKAESYLEYQERVRQFLSANSSKTNDPTDNAINQSNENVTKL